MSRRPEITSEKFCKLIDRIAHNLVEKLDESHEKAFKAVGFKETSVREWKKNYPDIWKYLWDEVTKAVRFSFGVEKQAEFLQLAYQTAKDNPSQSTLKILQEVLAPEKEDQTDDKEFSEMTDAELTLIIESEKAPARFIGKVGR